VAPVEGSSASSVTEASGASPTASSLPASSLPASSSGAPPVGKRNRARFYELEVAEVRPLTADSVEVTFTVPRELHGAFGYVPGQHVALRAEIDGHEIRRSYSLCRPPRPGSVSVAIKRDLGGRFSSWANSELHAGDRIDVMSPQGTFTSNLAELDGKHVV